jgi:hypothetical protein
LINSLLSNVLNSTIDASLNLGTSVQITTTTAALGTGNGDIEASRFGRVVCRGQRGYSERNRFVTGGFRGNLLLAGGKRMLDYTVALTGGELSRGQNQTDLLLDQLRRCTWAVRVRCGPIRSRKPVVIRDRRCRSKPAGLPCVPRRSGARLDVVCAGDLGHADINKHTWDCWNANDPNARNSAIG